MERTSKEKDKDFLKVIAESGGRANITEIKKQANLSRNEANGRFRKLEDEEIIKIEYEEFKSRCERKVAILTKKGQSILQTGEIGNPENTPVLNHTERIEELEDQLGELREHNRELERVCRNLIKRQVVLMRRFDRDTIEKEAAAVKV